MPGRRPNRRHRRGPLAAIIKAVLLVAFLLAVTAFVLYAPSPAPPPLTDEERQAGLKGIQEAKDTIEAARKDAKAGVSRPFTVTLTEKQIDAYIETDAEAQDVMRSQDIDRVWVRIGDGHVLVFASRSFGSLPLTAKAAVLPRVEDGSLRFEVGDVELGRVGLPGGIKERAKGAVESALGAIRKMLGDMKVSAVKAERGALTVSGTTR